ncbi:DEAD/DEAH box helicase [Microbispora rosea]|uniref:DEAD/DEAH box helicase n=1 Tax=Microbispora rosea TaxID=58117 RepID=UPI0037BBD0A4
MTALKLRRYQEDAITAVLDAVTVGQLRRVAVVLPTGMGKTVVFAHLATTWLQGRPGDRRSVVVLVHRDELINQAVDKLHQVDPDLTVGRIQGKVWETEADVIVASVQTVSRPQNLWALEGTASLVIADECHHASAPTWVATLEALGCFTHGGPPAVGFTATLSRADDRGLGDVFQEVVYKKGILDGIAGGHLVMPRGKAVTLESLDLTEATVSRGDYTASSLGDLLSSAGAVDTVAKAYADLAPGKPGVCFWPTVDLAVQAAQAMRDLGITAAPVYGAMPLEERRATLAAFSAGAVQVLTNAMVLTEGWDAPRAEVCVIARPTRSPSLYVQMVGRVLRPYPGKYGALVLDVVGATAEHKLATLAVLAEGKVREVLDGEDLLEAAEREEKEAKAAGVKPDWSLVVEDVDLFKRSASLWLTTRAGCWFVPVANGVVFLWPTSDPDRFMVGWKPETVVTTAQGTERGGWLRDEPLELEYAMELAEDTASVMSQEGLNVSRRTASWRKGRTPATDKQRDLAARLGVEFDPGVTKKDLADLITTAKASRLLDAAFTANKEALRSDVPAEVPT